MLNDARDLSKASTSRNDEFASTTTGTALVPVLQNESFPEETSVHDILAVKKPTVELLAPQIAVRWQKSVRGIIEIGHLVAFAEAKLTAKEKKELMQRLRIKKSYFSKLAKIGRDERLEKPIVFEAVPPKVSLLYSMTSWTDEEIEAAIAKGRLASTPNSSLKTHGLAISRRIPRAADRIIAFHEGITDDEVLAVDEMMDQLEKTLPVTVGSTSFSANGTPFALLDRHPRRSVLTE